MEREILPPTPTAYSGEIEKVYLVEVLHMDRFKKIAIASCRIFDPQDSSKYFTKVLEFSRDQIINYSDPESEPSGYMDIIRDGVTLYFKVHAEARIFNSIKLAASTDGRDYHEPLII